MIPLHQDNSPVQPIVIATKVPSRSRFRKYSKPVLAATAISTNWLSFYLKRKADGYYDKYEGSSNSSKIKHFYDRTEQYDLYSSLMLGVSTAATAAFFYYLISD